MICGFPLADATFCFDEKQGDARFCPRHSEVSCVSCGQPAARECTADLHPQSGTCGASLCTMCLHVVDDPVLNEGHRHEIVLSQAETVRQELVAAVELGLAEAVHRGLCHVPDGFTGQVAEFLLQNLSNHIMIKVLSGMASAQPDDRAGEGRADEAHAG